MTQENTLVIRVVSDGMLLSLTNQSPKEQERLREGMVPLALMMCADPDDSELVKLVVKAGVVEIISQRTLDKIDAMESLLEEIGSDPNLDDQTGDRIDAVLER